MSLRVGRWVERLLLLAVVCCAWAPALAEAQACPAGRFCFYVPPGLPLEGSHSGASSRSFDVVLSAPVKTVAGTYAIAGGAAQPFSVSPGESFRIPLPGASGPASAYGRPEAGGVFLVADSEDLTVDHREVFDSEQYSETIKRHSIALGTRFRLAGYALDREERPLAGIDAVLVYAPTDAAVTLTAPPEATLPFWSGTDEATLTVALQGGQTVALRTLVGRDLDGGLLTASAPVAVSSGGRGWSVANCGDDGMDGLVPVGALGTEYVVRLPSGSSTAGGESRVRVIADVDGTEVRVNGALVATLAAGTYHSFQPTALSYIVTSRPALVWMNGSINGCELETALIPPIAFAPALTSLSLDFNVLASTQMPPAELAILIATADVPSIRLDGAVPTFTSSAPVPGRPDLSYVRLNVGPGDRNVRAGSDFQAMLASRTAPSGLLAYYNPFRIPGCGDSGADPGEGCDDGNLADGDGCSSTCQVEPGFACTESPSRCTTVCGDGQVGAPTESCDDGNGVAGDGCNATCRLEVSVTAPPHGTFTNDPTPVVTGTADVGAVVEVALDDVVGTTTADTAGAFRFEPTAPLPDGPRTVTVSAVDVRGGRSTATLTITIDTATTLTLDVPVRDAVFADRRPTFRGTGELGSMVDVRVDGASVGTTTVRPDGSWELTASTPLAPGLHEARAVATDALANTVSSEVVRFTVDDSAEVTITAPADDERVTTPTPLFAGTGEPGASVALEVVDGAGRSASAAGVVDPSGRWSLRLREPLANGTAMVSVRATDPIGNTARAGAVFEVDASTFVALEEPTDGALLGTPLPQIRGAGEPLARAVVRVDDEEVATLTIGADGRFEVALTTPLTDGPHIVGVEVTDDGGAMAADARRFIVDATVTVALGEPARGSVLESATPTLSGSGEPGARVVVSIDGAPAGETIVGPDGRWTVPVIAPLGEGAHAVDVLTTDIAGNQARETSAFTTRTARFEIYNPPDGAYTREARPTISGIARPGAHVTVILDGVLLDTMIANASGSWSLTLLTQLAEGDHALHVTTTSESRVTSDDRHTFTVDREAALIMLRTPAGGTVVADATPTVEGVTRPFGTIELAIDGASIGTVSADAGGAWSTELPTPLGDGAHAVEVLATGATEDGTTAAGFLTDTATRVDVRVPARGAIIGSAAPWIVGTAEPLAMVTVAIDGIELGTWDADLTGTWVATPPMPLAPGAHALRATAIDPLGNTAETAVTFDFDPRGPDRDGDGRRDVEECPDAPCVDSDGDGLPDLADPDDDGDGLLSARECAAAPCPDGDGDGRPDALDADDDDDGRPTAEERADDGAVRDTDRDGVPDHLDPDDDGDSLRTRDECPGTPCPDSDGDETADYLAPDDDADGIPTAREVADSAEDSDYDRDGIPNWLDEDANGNGVRDGLDGLGDQDDNGSPDYAELTTEAPPITADPGDEQLTVGGGPGCSAAADAPTTGPWGWLALAGLGLLAARRRQRRQRRVLSWSTRTPHPGELDVRDE